MMKKMIKNKAGVLDNLSTLAVGIAGLAIVLVVTFLILSQGGEQAAEIEGVTGGLANCSSTSCNATKTMQEATGEIPGWVPLIVIAIIGSILLGLVKLFRR